MSLTCSLHVPEGAIGTQITAPEVIPTRAPALNTMQTPSQPYHLCGSVALIMNFFPPLFLSEDCSGDKHEHVFSAGLART